MELAKRNWELQFATQKNTHFESREKVIWTTVELPFGVYR